MVEDIMQTELGRFIADEQTFLKSLFKLSVAEKNSGRVDGAIIGTGRSDYTQNATKYTLPINDKNFLLLDIPGIEGNEQKYKEIIKNALSGAHVIFYVSASDKKAEAETLEKIKKYMRRESSVYAIFNLQSFAKKRRTPGIDAETYHDELMVAYGKALEIVKQTEDELKSFLGDKFKGSVLTHGLLSFCAEALDSQGNTTIVNNPEKLKLISDQNTFLQEYAGDVNAMRRDSQIQALQKIIFEKTEGFEDFIYNTNINKLRDHLEEMLKNVSDLRETECSKLKVFLQNYDSFESRCTLAKEDFCMAVRRIPRSVAASAFTSLREELFAEIETAKGRIKKSTVEKIYEKHKDSIHSFVCEETNKKLNSAFQEYYENIAKAEERLHHDLERVHARFVFAANESFAFDTSFLKAFKPTFKGFLSSLGSIASFTYSGFLIGNAFTPIIGGIIGSIVGFLAGVADRIWYFFASKSKKVNKAKAEMQSAFKTMVSDLTASLKKEIENLNPESHVDIAHGELMSKISKQKDSLRDVEKALDIICTNLNSHYINLK